MLCTSCNFENPSGMRFCGSCGSPLALLCPSCGSENPPGFNCCGYCGTALEKPPAAGTRTGRAEPPGSGRVAEPLASGRKAEPLASGWVADESSSTVAVRRQLTVLFCDLVGSTALSDRLDPEDLLQLVLDYQAAAVEVIERFEGHVAQYLGDGLLVYFGFPQAHEDDARRAVHSGLAIVEAIDELSDRLEREQGLRLSVRVGIHTGTVVAGEVGGGRRREQLAMGKTPNVAARLQGIAEPDTVVLSSETFQLTQGFFMFQPLGRHTFKGISEPVEVFRAVAVSDVHDRIEVAARRGLTPLVGRRRELEELLECYRRAERGESRVVQVSGEAGIGKSRLLYALRSQVERQANWWICRCSPYARNSAWYPLIGLARRLLRLDDGDSPQKTKRKLESAVGPVGLPPDEVVPLFASFLSLSLNGQYPPLDLTPQRQKDKTLEALLTLVIGHSEPRSTVLLVEDLHWVDPSTLEFLATLMDRATSARILTVLTARPEFEAPWGSRPYLTELILDRVQVEETETLISELTAGKPLPAEVLHHLVEKSDGNPLFVEEMTKTVLQSDLLAERRDRYQLTRPFSELAIPATLQDSLTARLDRLGNAREVAQIAAAIGREFSFDLLSSVSPLDESALALELDHLAAAGLVHRDTTSEARGAYIFKHALIQDTAYGSLVSRERRRLHRRIAEALASRPEFAETRPEVLAHHYTVAELEDPAIEYWQQAGERALGRSANLEAAHHLESALALLPELPESPQRDRRELALQMSYGSALITTRGYASPQAEQVYGRAQVLCEQAGDDAEQFWVLLGLDLYHMVRANLAEAQEIALRMVELAETRQDASMLAAAFYQLGSIELWMGDFRQALAHLERVLELAAPDDHSHRLRAGIDIRVATHGLMAMLHWLLGHPESSLGLSRKCIEMARETAHPYSLATALSLFGAHIHYFRNEAERVAELVCELFPVCEQLGSNLWWLQGEGLLAWARSSLSAADGDEPPVAAAARALDAYRGSGTRLLLPHMLGLSAQILSQERQISSARRLMEEALSIAAETRDRFWEPELRRVYGEALLLSGGADDPARTDPAAAERAFREALDLARRQESRSLELRIALSWGRLLRSRGEAAAARELVGGVYETFTEGFETSDLKQATAFLAASGLEQK